MSCALVIGVTALAQAPTPEAGVVRVKVQTQVAKTLGTKARRAAKGRLTTSVDALDASLKEIKGVELKPCYPPNPKYAAERAKYGIDQWYEVVFDQSVDPREAARVLEGTPGIEKANVKVPMVLYDNPKSYRTFDASKVTAKANTSVPFNDPRLSSQWHYYNDGSMTGSVAGSDINLFDAWKITTGSPNVIVAIVDGGIDYTHEDLAQNVLINEAELNGTTGVDNDNNGYIDDVYGWNFCTNSAVIYPHQHGTHVAGTVAAVNNNGIGVCGVAGGNGSKDSGVRLLSCQVFDSRSGTSEGDFAAALIYAAERGASIAQCSWGWSTDGYYEQDVIDAIRYFTNMARSESMTGGLCIFAAGNDGATGKFYPGCMDEVLCVGAMSADKTAAYYSNYGSWVDVMAPGGLMDSGDNWGVLSTLPGNTYGWNEGTSMACPHVSGIAALILSKYGKETLTPEILRNQIETTVNDFYTYNPGKEGLYGTGFVNAAKALEFGDETAPSKVTQITTSPAQDNITVEWVIPASAYDNVHHHIIYYSTEPFTADDYSKASSVVVDTKFNTSGETVSHVLDNLSAMTQYYIAIQAVNRYGNASELSEVVTARTNAGPKMTISKKSLTMKLNNGTVTPATFDIGNTDEGLLRWSYRTNTSKATLSSYAMNNSATLSLAPYAGTFGAERVATYSVVRDDDYVRDEYPKTFAQYESLYARIGDTDLSVSNSMAQNFTVDASTYPNGFNLTAVNIQGAYGKSPVIEIYKGSNGFNASNRLCSFTPTYFYYGGNMTLPEQYQFEAGESFWVVVHFDAAKQDAVYPLGIAKGDSEAASNALMSNDLGKTWTKLSEVLRSTSYSSLTNPTWTIRAISANPDWSDFITLNPASGTVKYNDTQAVEVSTNGQKLCNGSYGFNIYFDTNESEANTLKLPVTLTVSNMPAELKFNKVVNFGSLLVGQSKTLTVEVFNSGYGGFSGSAYSAGIYSSKISSSSEHFAGPDYLSAGFPARSTTQFDVTYTPKAAGSHTGTITFTDKSGNKFSVMVQGVATDPAKIAVDPASINVGELNVDGTAVETEFKVKNEGNYPLQFVFPKFSSEEIDGLTDSDTHRYGYLWTSNLNGDTSFAYDGNPALVGGTDITSSFNDNTWWSGAISTGFKFPYYGKEYSEVYITSYGGIAITPYDGNMGQWPVYPGHTYVAGTGLISAYGSELKVGPNTKIEYGKRDGKFVVNYKDILACVYDKQYTPISFHMTLSSSGDIEIFYDDYDNSAVFSNGRGLYIGINDLDDEDPLTITSSDIANQSWTTDDEKTAEGERYSYVKTGSAVKIIAPAANIVESVSPATGLVAPGESVAVKAVLRANKDMNAGATTTNIVVSSNDLVTPTLLVPFNATIVGDLQPELSITDNAVNFGKVFRTADASRSLTVSNSGRSAMTVTSVAVKNGKVSATLDLPAVIAAGEAKDIVITMPTDVEGSVNDEITVTTDCGTKTVTVSGEVIGCPGVDLSYQEVSTIIKSGASEAYPLIISNNGNEDLTVAVTTGQHLSYTPDYSKATDVSYTYDATVDNSDVEFSWVDIVSNGLGEQNNFSYYSAHDYVAVDLPFDFTFYGKSYKTMYIYNTGFVSFTQRSDEKMWPEPPGDFPDGSIYTNVIAPYWGLHSMDQTKTAGTYHYETEDQAVVSFMEYGNSMNLGVCYQVILNKDGSFKFQYKADESNESSVIFSTFGCAGISKEDASGIRLPDRYIAFNNAVEFSPVVEQTLAPGAKTTADIKVVADVMKGDYTSSINVATNVPGKEKIVIPVTLNVTGEAQPAFSDDVVIEHAATWLSSDTTDPLVQMGAAYAAYVEVKNDGTAPFTITSVENNGPQSYDDWFDEYSPMFTTFCYAEGTDWETGEPDGNYSWQQYSGQSFTVGTSSVRFAIPVLNGSEPWMTPGEYNVPLVFHLSGAKGVTEKTVNVKFVVTQIPHMSLTDKEVRVSGVAPEYEGSYDVKVTNDGAYALKGTAYIDLTGVGETTTDGASAISMTEVGVAASSLEVKGALQPFDVSSTSDNVLNLPEKGESLDYIRGLYYPAMPNNNQTYNYGSGTTYGSYKAATAYVAPEGGFNISHIYTLMKVGNIKDADVNVEVITGDDLDNGTVIGSGVYHISSVENSEASYQMVVPLKRAVYVPEGQEFTVVVTYPTGESYPTVLSFKEEAVVSERYLGWIDSYGWFDIASMFKETYGSLGYVISCLETTEGSSWVELQADGSTFSINPNESANLKLKFNASSAPLEQNNKAMLVIKSNDPSAQVVNLPVYLSKNAAPVVSATSSTILVNEGAEQDVVFTVKDADNDDLSLTLVDNGQLARLVSVEAQGAVTAINGNEATVKGAQGDVTVTVAVAPKAGDAGSYAMTLTATDVYSQEGDATVTYTVQHVNGAPVAVETEPITLAVGGVSAVVNFSDLFTDPEDDDLTYEVTLNGTAAQLYSTANSAIFVGVAEGSATAVVTATDPSGASAQNQVVINVEKASGLNDITVASSVKVWPNPVVETLYVNCGDEFSQVTISLVAISGQVIYSSTESNLSGSAHTIDVSAYPAGTYVLRVEAQNALPASYLIVKE
jgi:subtilisin family serine protease